MSARVTLVRTSPTSLVGAADGLLLMQFSGAITADDIDATFEAHTMAFRSAGRPIGVFAKVGTQVPALSGSARVRSEQVALRTQAEVAAHATVLPGDDLKAMTYRSVLSTIFLVSRSTYPRKVCKTDRDACEYLAATRPDTQLGSLVITVQEFLRTASPARL